MLAHIGDGSTDSSHENLQMSEGGLADGVFQDMVKADRVDLVRVVLEVLSGGVQVGVLDGRGDIDLGAAVVDEPAEGVLG